MTRERQINIAASKYIEDNSVGGEVCISSHKDSFIEGAEWADTNPKSPWISVDDDLPCNHREYVDLKYNSYTCQMLVRCKNGIYSIERMVIIGGEWGWTGSNDITHWMPIPKLKEEQL